MSDPLSIPAIGARQQQVEQEIQGIPDLQSEADHGVLKAELAYIKAQAKASAEVQAEAAESGRKPLAAERDLAIFEKTEDEWYAKRNAEIQADYSRSLAKSRYAELSSLQSRLRAAVESDKAHVRVGQG